MIKYFALWCIAGILPMLPLRAQDLSYGKKMYAYERWNSAKKAFSTHATNNAEAAYWLSETLIQMDDIAAANAYATSALTTFKNDPLLLVALAHTDLALGKKSVAKENFEKALALADNKNKVAVLNAIGRACGNVPLKYSDPDYGLEKLKQALSLDPKNAAICINIGDCYRKKLDGGAAVQAYHDAQLLDPGFTAMAQYKTGRVYATQQNCEALKRNFLAAVAADPDFMPAWRELFENYADAENRCLNIDTARIYFRKYTATADQGIETALLQVNFAYITKDYTTAILQAQNMMQAHGNNTPAAVYRLAAYAAYAQKNYAGTIEWIEQYFHREQNPDRIVTDNYRLLADAYDKSAQLTRAKENWLKAAEFETVENKKGFYYDQAAAIAVKMNDKSGAADIQKKAYERKANPAKADIIKYGNALYDAAQYNACITLYKTYLTRFPDDWRAPLWIARSLALLDPELKTGDAAPWYEKVLILSATEKNVRDIHIQAYLYLFAYSYNLKRDKVAALNYLENVLRLDPANATALQYKDLIKK